MTNMNDFNSSLIEEYRSNQGEVTGMFAGRPLLLLSTTGAKSGQTRVNPLMYLQDGDRWLVFASKGGAPTNPDWYYNVQANADVTVEIGTDTFEATATEVTGEERDELYARQAEALPNFGEYQEKTTRKIPVVALNRKG